MAPFRQKAATRLAAAQAALAEVDNKLAEIGRTRAQRLLAGDGASAIAKLDAEIATLQHAAQTERDRIRLLEAEAEREEAEAVVRRRADLMVRFQKKLNEADAVAGELQDTMATAEALFRKVI